jgi:hypothetical protein
VTQALSREMAPLTNPARSPYRRFHRRSHLRLSKPAVEKAVEKRRNREIDLSLARATMDNVSIMAKVSQLLRSNMTVRAQDLLHEQLWWQLEGAWSINREYKGALNDTLRPLLINVYPEIKKQVDISHFSHWPQRTLAEMTNFMNDADRICESQPVP